MHYYTGSVNDMAADTLGGYTLAQNWADRGDAGILNGILMGLASLLQTPIVSRYSLLLDFMAAAHSTLESSCW